MAVARRSTYNSPCSMEVSALSRYNDNRIGTLLLLAFIAGILCKALLPSWAWLMIAGGALAFFGYKLLAD
jgi:hypothetical protein